MAQKALNHPSSSSKDSTEEQDPLKEAQNFTKSMAAQALIQSEVDKSKASAEKAKAEAEEAKAKAERAKSGEGALGQAGFKVTGGIDMGHIDLAKEREDAAAELKRLKQEADDSARVVGQENQQLRDEIHKQELKVLEITLKTQIGQLGDMIKSNATKGSFMDQYNGMIEMAKTLGLSQPKEAGDLSTQIELKKLDFEQTRELKRLGREDRAEQRKWELALRRLDDERDGRIAETARQGKRDEMFANAPKVLGGFIAQGILDGGGQEGVSEAPRSGKRHTVEAGPGESGVVKCDACKQPVAIGPTARTAVCANCGAKYSIKRTEAMITPEPEPEPEEQ